MKLVIMGSFPGLNEYINAERTNRYKAAAMKRQVEHTVTLAARKCLGKKKFTRPVYMSYTWVEKNRRRDKDNVSSFGRKCIQDALVKGNWLDGDGWKHIVGFQDSFSVDADHPKIEVEIEEVEG